MNNAENRFSTLVIAGSILTHAVIGLAWPAPAYAEDGYSHAAMAVTAQKQVVRLPALKLGGIRGRDIMMITENGMDIVNPGESLQQRLSRASTLSEECNTR